MMSAGIRSAHQLLDDDVEQFALLDEEDEEEGGEEENANRSKNTNPAAMLTELEEEGGEEDGEAEPEAEGGQRTY